MPRIDVSFLLLAVLCLIVGLVTGIGIGIAHDFQFAPVHAYLNLVGFVSLAIFGLAYKLYPALQRSRFAVPHLAASGVGALVFPFGIWLSISREMPAVAIVGASIVLAGALMFAANFVWNVVLSTMPGRMPRAVPWTA